MRVGTRTISPSLLPCPITRELHRQNGAILDRALVTSSDQVIQQKRRSGGVRDSAVALALTLFIAGCAGQGMGTKETIGTGSGAARGGIAGGLLGGRGGGGVAGALVGATVGGLIGNRIGAALDEDDRSALAAQS